MGAGAGGTAESDYSVSGPGSHFVGSWIAVGIEEQFGEVVRKRVVALGDEW